MGHFIVGVLTGILICGVVMLVRCAAWYEHKHPGTNTSIRRMTTGIGGFCHTLMKNRMHC